MALGGTSYAATQLGDNAVHARNIAPDAVRSPKVKDRSLLAKDFAIGQLPRGKPGPPGTALGYALVVKCATGCTSTGGYMVESGNSSHVDNDHFHHPSKGTFCFNNNLEFNGAAAHVLESKNVVATVGLNGGTPAFAQADSAGFNKPNVGAVCQDASDPYGPNNAVVKVFDANGAAADPDEIFVLFN